MRPVEIKDGKIPSSRIHFNWKTILPTGLRGFVNRKNTILQFNCGGNDYQIKLKGVRINKSITYLPMPHARLMRERNDRFFMLVDLSAHGVGSNRKNGGYYLFAFERNLEDKESWDVERIHYSPAEAYAVGVKEGLEFHNTSKRGKYYQQIIF